MIAVFTTQNDPSILPVVALLEQRGFSVTIIAIDRLVQGTTSFNCTIDEGVVTFLYDQEEFDLARVTAAWFWHPKIRYVHLPRGHASSIEREMRKTLQGVWDNIETERWINHPSRVRDTQNKIPQQIMAGRLGLRTGKTVLTNEWSNVDQLGEKTVIKMPGIGIIDGPKPSGMYTTVLDQEKRTSLAGHSPFPGMHQPYIPKKREWRITVVGDKVFPVAIYTKEGAKDDWRRHQHTEDWVRFVSEALPNSAIEEKCQLLLRKLGLRYGAFDFIETPDGEMVFLEVNSAGQYGWLEDQLVLPISEAIADLLIEIADAHVHR